MKIHELINDVLGTEGISLSGIAPVGPMSVPDIVTPHAILTNAQSVICYGIPIPRGIIYADTHGLPMYWLPLSTGVTPGKL
jgi:hypothetical protein